MTHLIFSLLLVFPQQRQQAPQSNPFVDSTRDEQPNTVYETEPGSSRRVRYLSLYQWSDGGPKFAVFAKEVEP